MKHSMETTSGAITLDALRVAAQALSKNVGQFSHIAIHGSVDEEAMMERGWYPVLYDGNTTIFRQEKS